jgi:hypothetical protein
MVPLDRMTRLVGHRFPGGTYTIAHWENFLVHDAVATAIDGSGLAHPAMLFHVPIAGVGVTIADVFALCEAESDEAVRAGAYVWEVIRPLREEVAYRMDGGIIAVERKEGRRGGMMDLVTFRIDVIDPERGEVDASVTNTWVFLRRGA